MSTNPYRHLRVTEIPTAEMSTGLATATKLIWLSDREKDDVGALEEAIWYLQQELKSRGGEPAPEDADPEPEPAAENSESESVNPASTPEPAKAEEAEPDRPEPREAEAPKATKASAAAKFTDPVVPVSKARSGPPRKRATPAEPLRKTTPQPDFDDDDDDF
jgi:hypothetical protein